ncbi:MAG: TolC family protein [Kordiimonas sp.]
MTKYHLYKHGKQHLLVFVSVFALGACAGGSSLNKSWVMPSQFAGETLYPAADEALYSTAAPEPLKVSADIQSLLAQALRHNPVIKIAQSRQREAIANKDNIDAGFMPKVEVGARTTRTRTGNEASLDKAVTNQLTRGSAELRIPIDVFGKQSASSHAAAYAVVQVSAELQDTRLKIMRDVVVAALDAAEQSQLLELNARQLTTNRTSEQLTKLRYTKGQANIVDVLQQRDLVASLRQETPSLVSRRQDALDNLSLLSGNLPGSVTVGEFKKSPTIPEVAGVVTPQSLLGVRPDLQALKAGLDAADRRLAAAIRDRLPSFEFSSSAIATLMSGDISSVVTGTLSAAFTLFDGGAKRSIVRAERAALEQKGATYIEAWLRAVVEVDGFLSEEQRRAKEYDLAVARLDNARKLYGAAERRYRLGASDYLPVLSAKRTIEQQERSLLSLKASLMRARVRLHTAMGGKVWTENMEQEASAEAQLRTASTEV